MILRSSAFMSPDAHWTGLYPAALKSVNDLAHACHDRGIAIKNPVVKLVGCRNPTKAI